jgi:hypothetical protein
MKHLLSPEEIEFLRKIASRDCIIKLDGVSHDGIPTYKKWNDLIRRGYCKTAKVLNGPLGIWTGEYFIMPTEAGRTIIDHLSEVPLAAVLSSSD